MYIYTHFRLGSIYERVFHPRFQSQRKAVLKSQTNIMLLCALRHGFSSQSSEDYDLRPSARIHFYISFISRWDIYSLLASQSKNPTLQLFQHRHDSPRAPHLARTCLGRNLGTSIGTKGAWTEGQGNTNMKYSLLGRSSDPRDAMVYFIVTVIDVHPGRLTWVP